MAEKCIDFQIIMTQKTCLDCGGTFAVNKSWLERRYENGKYWHCPYCGMSWHKTESEISKLEKKLKNANNKLASEKARHDQTKASLRYQKGTNTKLKNRIKNGVCPCCNRHFKNLYAHMKNQHPDYKP